MPVKAAEVLLDLPEVRQQLPRGRGQLLVPVADGTAIKQRYLTSQHPFDLVVDLLAAAGQLLDSRGRVGLSAVDDLPQQLEDGVQPRLGADELALAQRAHPRQRLLHGGGGVEVRLVGAVRVVLAQPASLRAGPVVEVGAGALREAIWAALPDRVQLIIE